MSAGEQKGEDCEEICSYWPMLESDFYECAVCNRQPTVSRDLFARGKRAFDIFVDFDSPIPLRDRLLFRRAKVTWTNIIKGDLPAVESAGFEAPGGSCNYPGTIDDVYVCCQYVAIDGPAGVVGLSNPLVIRDGGGNGLPVTGQMQFDEADIQSLKSSGIFQRVIEHELAHVLGFGSLWTSQGIAQVNGGKCVYTGARARAEYKAISGCDSVPNTCGHWDETCLNRELMTPSFDTNTSLSRITIGSMEDLGFVVDYSTAEAFSAQDIAPSCRQLCPARNLIEGESEGAANDAENASRSKRRQLSAEGYTKAVDFGRSTFTTDNIFARRPLVPGTKYVGDQMVYILYMEDNELYSIQVQQEQIF